MSNFNKYTDEQKSKINKLQNRLNYWESTHYEAVKHVEEWQQEVDAALPHYRRAETILCNYLNECDRLLEENGND